MAGGHRRGGDGDRQRTEAVLAGAERAAPPGDARRRRAGRSVGGAGGAAEVPVVAAYWGGLQVQGVVNEDLWGPLRHRGRRVRKRVPRRWWRRAGQRAIARGAVVDHRPGLVPGERRGQPGRDGRGAVGPGAQLTQRREQSQNKTDMRGGNKTEMGGRGGGLTLASDMASFLLGGRGGGFSCSSPSWCRLPQDTDWSSGKNRPTALEASSRPHQVTAGNNTHWRGGGGRS